MWTLFGFFVMRVFVMSRDHGRQCKQIYYFSITLFNSKKHESFDIIYCTFKCIQQEVNRSFINVTLNKTNFYATEIFIVAYQTIMKPILDCWGIFG